MKTEEDIYMYVWYGRRAFSVAGPTLWNNLPVTIREAGTLTTFKSTLKTHLFRIAFKALC